MRKGSQIKSRGGLDWGGYWLELTANRVVVVFVLGFMNKVSDLASIIFFFLLSDLMLEFF